jgi:uncharacterized membrane protein YfcA
MVYSICAHTAVSFPLLIAIGVATGFFSALLGVGGGLIMVPFLIAVGISSDVAGASSVAITCGTAFTGVLAYKKIGNVNLKIGLNITAGAIVGGICGVLLTKALRISGNFDLVIHLLFLILLLFVGVFMMKESLFSMLKKQKKARNFTIFKDSIFFLFIVGFLVSILASIMGVGGGFAYVPVMIYLCGIPTKVALGTSLLIITVVNGLITIEHATLNKTVDPFLVFIPYIGSIVGVFLGVSLAKKLSGATIRFVFSLVLIAVAVKSGYAIFKIPQIYFIQ